MLSINSTPKCILNLSLFILLLGGLKPTPISAQEKKLNAGIELDILPFATGGYFAGAFIGKDRFRIRALTASVNKPDWSINKDFRKNHIQAYALLLDIYKNKDWKGLWIAGGLVYWQSSIQSKQQLQTAQFSNYLLNGSMGYQIKLGEHFYLGPWAGISLRIAGNTAVSVDQYSYTLPILNPEASLKVGYIWN